MATKIDIGGELNPRTVEGIVADASTIIDRTAEKRQDEINSEVSESLEGKQDAIADLETIRSGAASGSTAIQPTQIEDVVRHVDTGALEPLLDPSDYATTAQLNQLGQEKVGYGITNKADGLIWDAGYRTTTGVVSQYGFFHAEFEIKAGDTVTATPPYVMAAGVPAILKKTGENTYVNLLTFSEGYSGYTYTAEENMTICANFRAGTASYSGAGFTFTSPSVYALIEPLSEEIKKIEDNITFIGPEVDGINYTVSDADVHQVNAGSAVENPSGNRLRLLFKVTNGCAVSASCSQGKGVSVEVYNSVDNALNATQAIQTISGGYKASASGVVSVDGILLVSLCKSDSSSFSSAEKSTFLSATSIFVVKSGIADIVPFQLNRTFIGKGDTFSSTLLYGLKPGRTYRMVLPRTSWPKPQMATSYNMLALASWYNGASVDIISVKYGNTIADYYDFTVPSNSEYLSVGGRADVGESVELYFYDITDIGSLEEKIGYYKNNYSQADYVIRYNVNAAASLVDNPNGQRIRVIFPVSVGYKVFAKTTLVTGISGGIWSTALNAAQSSAANILQTFVDGYSTDPIDATVTVAGWACISLTNGNSAISDARKEEMLQSLIMQWGRGIEYSNVRLDNRVSNLEGAKSENAEKMLVHKKMVSTHYGNQGLTIIGDIIAQFNSGVDDHSSYAAVRRWAKEDFTFIDGMTHNLGHAATIDYDSEIDALVVGNGTSDTSVAPRLDIVLGASAKFANGSSLNFNDPDILHIELKTTQKEIGGSGLICCFGGNWREVFLATGQNAPRKIFRCLLGVGEENFSDNSAEQNDVTKWGTFISGKTNSEYNGTLKVLATYTGEETQVYQGMCYRAGFIYLACGYSQPLVHKIRLYTNGRYEIVQTNIPQDYNADGSLKSVEPEGLCFYDWATMLIALPSYGGLFQIEAF